MTTISQSGNALIVADYREQSSGIPGRLQELGAKISINTLRTADYIIQDEIAVERKTAPDFIQSLVSGRLFDQCARLARSGLRTLLLLEGNPFKTRHEIDNQAIKGALLSVAVSWQIPVVYSMDQEDSSKQLLMTSMQAIPKTPVYRQKGYRSKRLNSRQLQFLQGLPNTGAVMADKLYKHFGSIEAVINADIEALQAVEGIGKKSAVRLKAFITGQSISS